MTSVVDRRRFDADTDHTFYFDADPDPDPTSRCTLVHSSAS
jgi:hypothetical protein